MIMYFFVNKIYLPFYIKLRKGYVRKASRVFVSLHAAAVVAEVFAFFTQVLGMLLALVRHV